MSILRIVSPLGIGIAVAAALNAGPAVHLLSFDDQAVSLDTSAACDSRHITANWRLSTDRPGLVESVRIGNIADACDGGTLYVLTEREDASPPAVNIPVGASTQLDVSLGLPVEAVQNLTIVIVAPNAL